jgi:hypothetical protein
MKFSASIFSEKNYLQCQGYDNNKSNPPKGSINCKKEYFYMIAIFANYSDIIHKAGSLSHAPIAVPSH